LTLEGLLQFLDTHNGAVIAFATIAYAVITLLLLFEARSGRVIRDVANLQAYPAPHGLMYVAVQLVNYGPAIAEDVTMRLWLTKDGKPVEPTKRVHVEPVYPVDRTRTFLLHLKDDHIDTLNTLAEEGYGLEIRTEWVDGRRRRLRGERIRHDGRERTSSRLCERASTEDVRCSTRSRTPRHERRSRN
jgi:hypothetical protein